MAPTSAQSSGIKKKLRDLLGHYIGDEFPFFRYDFETGRFSGIVDTRATKRPNVGGSVVLDVFGREIAWLKVAYNACIESCELK